MQTEATVIADSITNQGVRVTTMQLRMHRFILAEFNTHRTFCLSGETDLEFDLPGFDRRVHHMTMGEFYDKWNNGAAPRKNKPRRVLDYSEMSNNVYSTKELATLFNITSSNLNTAARKGQLSATYVGKKGRSKWLVKRDDFIQYWERDCINQQPIRDRLKQMRIRQLNEDTGIIQNTNVVDCVFSGYKNIYELKAGGFSVSASKDHRILTTYGWKTLENILPGVDEIVVRKFGKKDEDRSDPKRLKFIDGRWVSVFNRKHRAPECSICGSADRLEIHHQIPINVNQKKAFEVENITTLCRECHNGHHETQGWQGGTYLYGGTELVSSINYVGYRPTYDLEVAGNFPNFLGNGVVVHNSRNTSSSRAIPTRKLRRMVLEHPAMPMEWGVNQKGMHADDVLSPEAEQRAIKIWKQATANAVQSAEALEDEGVHKQITNRLLEPFMWANTIVTATEWANFYNLRVHHTAQPEFRLLAEMMYEAITNSHPHTLGPNDWHMPYAVDSQYNRQDMLIRSVARCARVSYLTFDGKQTTLEADTDLYHKLLKSGHMSPFEHQCAPGFSGEFYYNLRGWKSLRYNMIHKERKPCQ